MKKLIVISLIASTFSLTGCAFNATTDKMVYRPQSGVTPKRKELKNNIALSDVKGGKEINLLVTPQISNLQFKAALEESLKQANLYHQLSNERYLLKSTITHLDQEMFGINLKVMLSVLYTIEDTKTNKVIYNKTILTDHTATFNDSAIAVIRLRIADEGAARKNIEQFITDIENLS